MNISYRWTRSRPYYVLSELTGRLGFHALGLHLGPKGNWETWMTKHHFGFDAYGAETLRFCHICQRELGRSFRVVRRTVTLTDR